MLSTLAGHGWLSSARQRHAESGRSTLTATPRSGTSWVRSDFAAVDAMTRLAIVVLDGLVAVSAIAGAIWVVPTMPLEWIKAGPFDDWTIPAIALGFVGVLAAMALVAVLVRPWLGALASIVAGAAMIAFEVVEIAVVGWTPADPLLNGSFQAWLQPIYLVVGSAQLLLGIRLWLAKRVDAPPLPIVHRAGAAA